jgi:hypothetical protein
MIAWAVSAGCRPFSLLRKSDDLLLARPCQIRPRPRVWLAEWLSKFTTEGGVAHKFAAFSRPLFAQAGSYAA